MRNDVQLPRATYLEGVIDKIDALAQAAMFLYEDSERELAYSLIDAITRLTSKAQDEATEAQQ
ncbi:hypothetical protein [Rahnella sp. ChDrAdgB13]|uniref:hypothetical protein n=1 Tax=Rahnella sp. ChDrAdgB13 TaxID=1850581 RepID=UPI001AD8646B|nr:hypothetical protein [Rahnella sp. ChDrAdgB13]